MKVVIIGSGNVAHILSRLMQSKGHTVCQIVSRNIQQGQQLAKELNASFSDFNGPIYADAAIYLIAVTDQAIKECIKSLPSSNKLVLHTAASVSKDLLKEITPHYGVLYPLQSLRKKMNTIPHIPFLIDGSDDTSLHTIQSFACSLSPQVRVADDEERIKLHVAAVVVNNFTNHLYALAEAYCIREKVDFNLLKPLIEETALRIRDQSPLEMQTGPAIRNDIQTMNAHLSNLSAHPKLKDLYVVLSDSLMGK